MVCNNKIRLASALTFDSIVDGPGLRMVLWTQGCPHGCLGCHNPQTHDPQQGIEVEIDHIVEQIQSSNLQSGLTLSGGEPFLQSKQLLKIVDAAKQKGLNVWAYSGFTFEHLTKDLSQQALLKKIDVLVDGIYLQDKKDYRLLFKGSTNQRIIDVVASLQHGKIVLHEIEKENALTN